MGCLQSLTSNRVLLVEMAGGGGVNHGGGRRYLQGGEALLNSLRR
jgi:hypothetical protein